MPTVATPRIAPALLLLIGWGVAACLAAGDAAAVADRAAGPCEASPPSSWRGPGAEPLTADAILASQPPDVVEDLLEGKVVLTQELAADREGSERFIAALVIFDQPRDRTMRLLTQTARQIEFRPELKHIETVDWLSHGNIDEQRLRIMFVKVVFRQRNCWDLAAGRMWWELDPDYDNDLSRLEGFWEFYELSERRTLARFGTRLDVSGALPGFLQDYITRRNVPQNMERVRKWVNSNGRFRH